VMEATNVTLMVDNGDMVPFNWVGFWVFGPKAGARTHWMAELGGSARDWYNLY
jgi:hypothetical protein